MDPDVYKTFRDARAANEALRLVIKLRRIPCGGRRSSKDPILQVAEKGRFRCAGGRQECLPYWEIQQVAVL